MTHFIAYTSYAKFEDRFNVEHEFDEWGSHKIIIDGHEGFPALWSEVAYLDYKGWRFCGTTEHFWPALPEIFIVTEVKGRSRWGALEREKEEEVISNIYQTKGDHMIEEKEPLVKHKMQQDREKMKKIRYGT